MICHKAGVLIHCSWTQAVILSAKREGSYRRRKGFRTEILRRSAPKHDSAGTRSFVARAPQDDNLSCCTAMPFKESNCTPQNDCYWLFFKQAIR